MKQCVSCLQFKEEAEFNWRYKALGIRHPTCRDCQKGHRDRWYQKHKEAEVERVKIRRESKRDEAREYVWNYLATHPCVQCGESDVRVLEFHHRRGKDKTISQMMATGYLISAIQKEIDKCDVLCANCHRKITLDQLGWLKGGK
jgi:hypothetical protein